MAIAITGALRRLRHNGLSDLPTDAVFEQLCRQAGHCWRERLLTPLLTLKLFILQIAHGNTAINHLRQLTGLGFAPGSYCQARLRLPLAALQGLLAKLLESAQQSAEPLKWAAEPLKRGWRVLVVDGTGFSMPDTPELLAHFGMPPRQQPGVGYPVGKVMAMLDLATGMLVRTLALPLFTHDMRGVAAIHPFLRAGDVLVGDRAFCSVLHIMQLSGRSIHCLFRLHQRRKNPQPGAGRWKRPKACPVWMDKATLKALPAWLGVRIIHHVIEHKGYRTRVLYLATTLPAAWSDDEVRALYRRRWEIETCFGHLKTGMKMNVLKCRSVEGVIKELTVYLLVYNLVRLLMLRWARQAQADARRVSFIDACRLLTAWLMGLPGCARLIVNPDRQGRAQLRRVRRRPKKYPLLKAARATYTLPENQRKTA